MTTFQVMILGYYNTEFIRPLFRLAGYKLQSDQLLKANKIFP